MTEGSGTRQWQEASALADRAVADGSVPSVSMALATADGLDLVTSVGHADLAAARPATADTPYSLASVTKPIVATTAVLLAQQGVLDLDRPVTEVASIELPSFAGVEEVPTVRQTLQHRGGFGTHHDFRYDGQAPALGRLLSRYAIRYRTPGTGFEYSNLGYGLLGLIIEEVARRPAAQVIDELVMQPLGISGFTLDAPGPARSALRYAEDGTPYPPYDTSHGCASLGWLDAAGLARFGAAHTVSSDLLDESARRQLHQVPAADAGYALGWAVLAPHGETMLVHGGSMGGTSALLSVVPARNLAAAVLVNATDAGALMQSLTDLLIGGAWPAYPPAQPPAPPRPGLRSELVGKWAGAITVSADRSIGIAVSLDADGRLTATVDGQTATGSVHPTENGLTVTLPLQLQTDDALIDSPQLALALEPVGPRLDGAARALKSGEGGGRIGNCYSYWCSLSRAA